MYVCVSLKSLSTYINAFFVVVVVVGSFCCFFGKVCCMLMCIRMYYVLQSLFGEG